MIAAPNVSCAIAGRCPAQSTGMFLFDGQSSGSMSIADSQSKSTIRFYAWAAHEQMPLRSVNIDWGDGSTDKIADAWLKNRKPFCEVTKECSDATKGYGLTCNTDEDCPAGAGQCLQVGVCNDKTNIQCHSDNDCKNASAGERCNFRTLFGNSSLACETGVFEFSHYYWCKGTDLPPCNAPFSGTIPGTIPAGIQNNQCYFGITWDPIVMESQTRPTCSDGTTNDCIRFLREKHFLPSGSDIDSRHPPEELVSNIGMVCVNRGAVGTTTYTTKKCSRDPAHACVVDNNCAPGDRCIEGLAPPEGCWDQNTNSCRFTPRVMVQDNWGWCTGECRDKQDSGGAMCDNIGKSLRSGVGCGTLPIPSPTVPKALHPFGGCYSGEAAQKEPIQSNVEGDDTFGTECEITNPKLNLPDKNYRPWIVYPGALNLRASGELSPWR
jgi:hypothetical protein